MDFGAIIGSALTLGGVGGAFGALIAVAHRRFRVFEDPRIDVVADMLPGANCGACGQAGCRAFAEALVGGRLQPAGCTVMAPDAVQALAAYLGVEAGQAVRRVARLLCAGGRDVAIQQAEYRGLPRCSAAARVAGGGKGCAWGCLGLADCAEACDFDAIYMNDGAARRDPRALHGVRRLRRRLPARPLRGHARRAEAARAVPEPPRG